ncbi:hypothetical protein ABZS68_20220 [Streptomyces sp. NPDC005571]|uniref:hypothetical protein n=1 Tax=Streptomyces sp. NPDC005571 TaxID=3156888 RepID=UPI0033BB8510
MRDQHLQPPGRTLERPWAGDRHVAAQRNLFNRFMGMLFYCLQNGHIYDEAIAFPQPSPELAAAAA